MNIFFYEVFIPKDQQYENEFKYNLLSVAVQNEELIVINDSRFTTINKAASLGSDLNKTLNKFHVSEWKTGIGSLDGIFYTEYSDHAVTKKTIRRRIEKFIQSEYSWTSNINLSFLEA